MDLSTDEGLEQAPRCEHARIVPGSLRDVPGPLTRTDLGCYALTARRGVWLADMHGVVWSAGGHAIEQGYSSWMASRSCWA